MVLVTEPVSRQNTFVGGTCASPSALLVCSWILNDLSLWTGHFGHSCHRETARHFVSLNIVKSLKITQGHSKWHCWVRHV